MKRLMNCKSIILIFLLATTLSTAQESRSKVGIRPWPRDSVHEMSRDTRSDTWVAVDELGRKSPGQDIAGAPRDNRAVGLFFYMWLNEDERLLIHDIEKILAGEQSWGNPGAFHFYSEPLYGYYSSRDEYVIRRQMQMIADAQVDFIFFDVTNRLTYEDTYKTILSVMSQMREEGYQVPQVAFLTNTRMDETIEALYEELYGQGLYSDFWFIWEEKPLLMGVYNGDNDEIRDFFTYKRSWAWTNGQWYTEVNGEDRWPWLDNYPQKPGYKHGIPEYISVTTAQHPHGQFAIGKSTGANRENPPVYSTEGTYFNLQWQRALEVDPPVIGITQWNEFLAQRFVHPDPRQPVSHMVRKPLKPGESIFIDVYTPEYSRDIEPLRGYYRDNMYLQMVSNIRKYKGVRTQEPAKNPKTVKLNTNFSQWNLVGPSFLDDIHDTRHRHHVSYGSEMVYTNNTGRNDFDELKVSYDKSHLYFYVRTIDDITPPTGDHWMMLLINADSDYSSGWHGYDFIVNHTVLSATETTVKAHKGTGFDWDNPQTIQYVFDGNEMHLAIPVSALGIDTSRPFVLDFKWVDNSLFSDDIIDLYVDGDTAPNNRFNYRYISK